MHKAVTRNKTHIIKMKALNYHRKMVQVKDLQVILEHLKKVKAKVIIIHNTDLISLRMVHLSLKMDLK